MMERPVMNYVGSFAQLGQSLNQLGQAGDQAIAAAKLRQKLEDFDTFKQEYLNEVLVNSGSEYTPQAKASLQKRIQMIEDPQEFLAKVSAFEQQNLMHKDNPNTVRPQFGMSFAQWSEINKQNEQKKTGEVAGIAADNTLRTGVAQAPKWQAEDKAMEGAPPEAGFNLQKSQLGQGGMTPNYLEPNPNPTQEQFLGEAAKIAPGMPSSQLTETAAGAQFPTQKQQFAESREANVQGRHEQNLLEKQRARIQRHQENQQSIGIAKQNIEKGIVTGLIENIPTQVRMVELDYQDLNDELDGLNTQLEAAKATKNAMSADTIKSQMKDIENQRKALEKQHKELLDLEVKAKDKARSLAGIPPSQVGGATEPNPREPRGSRTPAPTITPSIPETIPTPIIDLKSKYGLDY